jgi:hypothetical protein
MAEIGVALARPRRGCDARAHRVARGGFGSILNPVLAWVNAWPTAAADPPLPRAVRVRIVLASGEEIVRVFALQS